MARASIGIIGCGTIGSALAKSLARYYSVKLYDPKRGLKDDLSECEAAFVCVPTDQVEAAIASQGQRLAICSTVPLGTCDRLGRNVAHVPVFCDEDTAERDLKHLNYLVVGANRLDTLNFFCDLLAPLLRAKAKVVRCSTVEAELIKLATNSYFAVKVAFANEIYDVAQVLGADFEVVRAGLEANRNIASNHLDVWHKGYRGFGGKCLAKDVDLLLASADKMMGVLEAATRWRSTAKEGLK